MSDSDLLDHGRRIAELERKVSELYKRLGQAEPSGFGDDSGFFRARVGRRLRGPPGDRAPAVGQSDPGDQALSGAHGVGLAEAKDAVDRLAAMYRPTG